MAKVGRNQPCPCGSGKKYKKCCWGDDQRAGGGTPLARSGFEDLTSAILQAALEGEEKPALDALSIATATCAGGSVEGVMKVLDDLRHLLAAGGPLEHVRFPVARFERAATDVFSRWLDANGPGEPTPMSSEDRDALYSEIVGRVASPPQVAMVQQALIQHLVSPSTSQKERVTAAAGLFMQSSEAVADSPTLMTVVGVQLGEWLESRQELAGRLEELMQGASPGEVTWNDLQKATADPALAKLLERTPGVAEGLAEDVEEAVHQVSEEMRGDNPLPFFTFDERIVLEEACADLFGEDGKPVKQGVELLNGLSDRLGGPLTELMEDVNRRLFERAANPNEPARKRYAHWSMACMAEPVFMGLTAFTSALPTAWRDEREAAIDDPVELISFLRERGEEAAAARLEAACS